MRLWGLIAILVAACATLATAASPTFAATPFCLFGSGEGQCQNPSQLAVDYETGRLYVADRNNNRVDVFDANTHDFIEAFGWGVADGTSAEAQSCAATCFEGLPGGGAGQFTSLSGIAVDNDPASPSHHDLFVLDGARVARLSPDGTFLGTWGGGVITGGAVGKGTLNAGLTQVTSVTTSHKAFDLSQTITGVGIPAGTKIAALGQGSMTLSKPATASGSGVVLSVAEGPGNVPANEVQKVAIRPTSGQTSINLKFTTSNPSPTLGIAAVSVTATGAEVQAALESIPNLGAGNVTASGPAGGPWTVEFKGFRYADTNVDPIEGSGDGNLFTTTEANGGAAAETCSVAIAESCAEGIVGAKDGSFNGGQIAVSGSAGTVSVADKLSDEPDVLRLQQFDPSGSQVGKLLLNDGSLNNEGLAVEADGDFYLDSSNGVQKFHADGTKYGSPYPLGRTKGRSTLAIDPATEDLFVTGEDGSLSVITEYSSAGSAIRRFGYGEVGSTSGLVPFHSASGDVFVSSSPGGGFDAIFPIAYPPPGPVIASNTLVAFPVGNTKATLEAKVNPESKDTSYRFEYVDDATYQADTVAEGAGHGFEHAKLAPQPDGLAGSEATLQSLSVAVGCAEPVVEAPEGKCLKPDTLYHVRLVATNADGSTSQESQFTTKSSLQVGTTWATDISTDAARLHAEVNPLGIDASAYFQYVDEATFQQSGFAEALSAPDQDGGQAPLDLGKGEADRAVSSFLFPLKAATTYRYRIVVTNPFVSVDGEVKTLTTEPQSAAGGSCPNQERRAGASANLPDCRAYEMVSPIDKNNGDVIGLCNINCNRTELNQASLDGERLTFSAATAFAGSPGGQYSNQYLATRTPDGWSTEGISPPHTAGLFGPIANTAFDLELQFKAFSPDLADAWMIDTSATPLTPEGLQDSLNIYRRNNLTGEFEALTTNTPTVIFERSNGQEIEGKKLLGSPEFQAFSADRQHAVFTTSAALTPDAVITAPVDAKNQLYEFSGGELHLVSILPNGKANPDYSWAGTYTSTLAPNTHGRTSVKGAISEDGSRIFWSSTDSTFDLPGQQLYVRINPTQPQSKITAGKCTQLARACTVFIGGHFWAATPNGSKALTTNGNELRVFDVDTETSTTIAGGVSGVVGASEDLSRIYFVSTEALAAGAEAGHPNLYLSQGGSKRLVATLSTEDLSIGFNAFGTAAIDALSPENHAARVSPDGSHLAFQSVASLPGYDNTDANNGKASLEVFVYDAEAEELHCVSCNRTGGRPEGQALRESFSVVDQPINGGPWAAAWIPTFENSLHGPQALANDGNRLFFNSFDALVARDTNGRQDVYQWEAPGSGSCMESSPSFSVVNGGCVSLISSGQGADGSELIDASSTGNDVFFRTASDLDPRDDGLLDIYDARVNGGYPSPATRPAACEGEACQGAPSPPNDPTPASSVFQGAGNVVEKKAKKKSKKAVRKKHHRKQTKGQKSKRTVDHERGAGR
jgi:hypothetical protein